MPTSVELNDAITHFVMAASPLISIYPLIYILVMFNRLPDIIKKQHAHLLYQVILSTPILLGLFTAIIYGLIPFVPRKLDSGIYLRFISAGAIAGFLLSIVYHYVFDVYRKLDIPFEHLQIHIVFMVCFFVVFYTIGLWQRYQLLQWMPPTSNEPVLASVSNSSHNNSVNSSTNTSNNIAKQLQKLESIKQSVNGQMSPMSNKNSLPS